MPLTISYGPYVLSALAVIAYALRCLPLIPMNCIVAFAYAWCCGRDYSLHRADLMTMDVFLTVISAAGAFAAWHWDRGGYRE
jgi:hypothetical protein